MNDVKSFFAAGILHGAAAAGISFLAAVYGAYDGHNDKAGYGNYCYD